MDSLADPIGSGIAWHGRLMVAAWSVLVPLGILAARFGKVMPWQDWPAELDNQIWWRTHLIAQVGGAALASGAVALILGDASDAARTFPPHRLFGWLTLAAMGVQVASGLMRGTKGGPKARDGMRGDHYDMTPRRRAFEAVHKGTGYAALGLACAATFTGLHAALAPVWMIVILAAWWAGIGGAFIVLERRIPRMSTYHAIWGPDPAHPGNHRAQESDR